MCCNWDLMTDLNQFPPFVLIEKASVTYAEIRIHN